MSSRTPGSAARGVVESLVDLAGALVDRFGGVVVDRPAGERGDLAREPFAVDTDERAELFPCRGEVELPEDLEPGLDARLDRVHERAVEIEDHGIGCGQVVDGGHGSTVARLDDDKTVAAGVITAGEGRETGPGADRELPSQVRHVADDLPVVPRVGDQEDQPRNAGVALLRPRLPLDRLDIVDPRLGFDDRGDACAIDPSIAASEVAFQSAAALPCAT